jgi:hypothetical protein
MWRPKLLIEGIEGENMKNKIKKEGRRLMTFPQSAQGKTQTG